MDPSQLRVPSRQLGARACIVLGAVAYSAVLHWAYTTAIAPWRYLGYAYYPPSLPFQIGAWGIAVAPSLWIPATVRRPSQIGYWLLYIVAFVPSCFVPLYTACVDPNLAAAFSLYVLVAFALLGMIYVIPLLRIPRIRLSRRVFWAGVAIMSSSFYIALILISGLKPRFVSLEGIYELRSSYKAIKDTSGGILGYIVGWQSNAVNSTLMATGLSSGSILMFAAGVVGQAVIYSVTGYKSALFSGGLLLVLFLMLSIKSRWRGVAFIWGAVGAVFVATWLQLWFGEGMLFSIFVRRFIFTPGLLTGYYLDFFSQGEKAYLGHSILRSIFHYPYALAPAYEIGARYFDDPSMAANANLWADAYANFGFPGVFGFTCLAALIMYLFDSLAREHDIRFTGLLFGMPAFYLTNTALFTSVLTHGIGVMLAILYFLPRAVRGTPVAKQTPGVHKAT